MGIASAVEWSYERVAGLELARCDSCSGRQLKPHFHDTHQIAVLLSGRRRFRVSGRTFDLEAGEILFIPAMVPHVGDIGSFRAINLYLPADSVPDHRRPAPFVTRYGAPEAAVSETAERVLRLVSAGQGVGRDRKPDRDGLIALFHANDFQTTRCAAKLGITREAFIRRFRRLMHMPPAAYGRQRKLNRARSLLAAGMPLAHAAAEAGFADQSHLGRCFREAFGTTPALYQGRRWA